MRGASSRRASTTCPSTHRVRGVTCAKDIRTWNAMRVFSGSTFTGPIFRIAPNTASKIARTSAGFPAKCVSKSCFPQKCDWFRFANSRPQPGQRHNGLAARFRQPAGFASCFPRIVKVSTRAFRRRPICADSHQMSEIPSPPNVMRLPHEEHQSSDAHSETCAFSRVALPGQTHPESCKALRLPHRLKDQCQIAEKQPEQLTGRSLRTDLRSVSKFENEATGEIHRLEKPQHEAARACLRHTRRRKVNSTASHKRRTENLCPGTPS